MAFAFRRGRYARGATRINDNPTRGRCAGSSGESSTRSRNLRDAAADDARMTWHKVDAGLFSLVVKVDGGRIVGAWLGVLGVLVADVRVGLA